MVTTLKPRNKQGETGFTDVSGAALKGEWGGRSRRLPGVDPGSSEAQVSWTLGLAARSGAAITDLLAQVCGDGIDQARH